MTSQPAVPGQRRALRAGVIGLGAGRAHMAGYVAADGVELVAIAGKEKARLTALADELHVPHTFEDWQDLVARDDIDVVSVATPNFLHAPVTIGALEAGKHVLCEKPLSVNAEDASRMVEAATAAGRVLEVAFNFRRRGDISTLRRILDTGELGRIYHAKASWLRRSGIPGAGSWFTNRQMAGGGPLIDLGVHVLDLALYLMDEPRVRSVTAATYHELGARYLSRATSDRERFGAGGGYDVEDLASAFLRLDGGATLRLEAAWAHFGKANEDIEIELLGTRGGAQILIRDYADADTLRVFTDIAGQPATTSPRTDRSRGHAGVVADFVDVVRSGAWSDHVGLDGLRRARIIDACYTSARDGREVAL